MTNKPGIVIVGAGGYAKVVLSTIRAMGLSVQAFYDDDPRKWGSSIQGVTVHGPISKLKKMPGHRAAIGVENNIFRRKCVEELDLEWITAIHPRSCVDPQALIGRGAVVCAGSVVQPEATVSDHSIINTGATVDHNCTIGSFAHIATGSHLCGTVSVGTGTFVGAGSTVIENVSIGNWSLIEAGSVVIRDLGARILAMGNPARIIRKYEASHSGCSSAHPGTTLRLTRQMAGSRVTLPMSKGLKKPA